MAYVKSGILFALMIVIPIFFIMRHEGVFKSKKEPIKKISKAGEHIDFFDEILAHMSAVIGSKINYADKWCMRGLSFKHLTHNSAHNGKQMACESVQIRFMLKIYPHGVRRIVAYAESSYGSPRWDGQQMHYDYPIGNDVFEYDVNDFQSMWNAILDKFYIIDVEIEETSERVRNGNMSYWTEQKYGHLL